MAVEGEVVVVGGDWRGGEEKGEKTEMWVKKKERKKERKKSPLN